MVLSMVLYMVLSDTLADRCMARRQKVRWKGCFTLHISGLLQVGLFLVAVHVIFPFVFCLWEGAGISSKKVPKVRKDFIHTGRQTKNATEDESSLQTHACKQVFTNTRQQATMSDNRKTKTQVKNTDEYRSKNRWMEIDIEQRGALEEANQNKPEAETFLQQTQDQSQRRLILSYVSFKFCWGPSGTHWPGQCLMKCSSQDVKVFAACELPFYKGALCAFSLVLWQLQDGDG